MKEILIFVIVVLVTYTVAREISYAGLTKEYNICMDLHEPGVSAIPVD